MSDFFDLPANEHDIYNAPINDYFSYIITAINAYDDNQERINELESHTIDMGKMAKDYVDKISTLTHENALLENQLKNAHAEIAELKKKAQGY